VVIVAATKDRELLFVEQHRIPLNSRVIELPAGLAGDSKETAGEPLVNAAKRELLEETGYAAESFQYVTEGPISTGLSTEIITIYYAGNAVKVAAGGGDAEENIQVHAVPLEKVKDWLEQKRKSGCMIDPKVYAGLHFVERFFR
jgi:ADP-ribose pyrophosphatase